ncbi:radical SAM protein [Fervidobacterium sp. SC_NGM5_G05]|nr:radical SAM protein [Fervidobacterium sp. SC_NGM5_G05]
MEKGGKNTVGISLDILNECTLCPRMCKVDRREKIGVCTVGYLPKVSNIVLHKGEEPPLSGENGAGAVFFSGCPMKCIYCQNMGFSQKGVGFEITLEELANAFLKVQQAGAKTLDLVTPTPHIPWILMALDIAKENGFNLPVVYNTSSYERVEILKELSGYVDIYLADIRYTDNAYGLRYSKVENYWDIAQKAIEEMYNQVGPFDEEKMKGLIIRILVMPNKVSGHEKALEFIANLDKRIPVALMSQYIPHFGAKNDTLIGRKITKKEYEDALDKLIELDLDGWMQLDEKERVTTFPIDWRCEK